MANDKPIVVSLISLGCDKNTVDSERLLARLVTAGFLIAESPQDSDVALVNTCGFIAEAREESRRVLEALAAGRHRGRPRRIVALGCLVERLGNDEVGLPADAAVAFADYPRIAEICRDLLQSASPSAVTASVGVGLPSEFHRGPRLLTGLPHLASLKISEGCSNRCRYCAIPLIRGAQTSRPIEEIVSEARDLAAAGAREISIIGQDTANYGADRYGERCLPRLLRALLAATDPETRFRLMYAHPRHVSDELLDTLAADERFLPYLDLPLQHVNDRLLAAMGRGVTKAELRQLLERIRRRWPAAALRTTYIVGFPGETEAEFEELRAWVSEGAFLHAGVFAYSSEAGTPASALPDDVPPSEKERRRAELMIAQQAVSRARLRAWIGCELEVCVDGSPPSDAGAPRGTRWIARAPWQAPDVDGVVWLRGRGPRPTPGERRRVTVTDALDYDLIANLG